MAKTQQIKPVYVIYGQAEYLKLEALEQLKHLLIGDDDPTLALTSFEGTTVELAAVMDDLCTLPFLTQRRVVLIQDADKFVSTYRKHLERYVENPSTSGVLILICKSWPANTRLAKLLNKVGSAIQASAPRGRALVKWLTNHVGQYNKTMQLDTAAMLIETIGTDLGRLACEVEKLAIFCADRRQIRSQDVEALCGITAQQSIFEMNDLLAEGKLAEALGVLDRLLQQDRSAQFTLVGAVSWSLRRLLQARTMLDNGQSRQQILQTAKVYYPSMADRFMRQVQSLSYKKLTRLLQQLAETDLANKTGLGNVQLNLEKFIVESSI